MSSPAEPHARPGLRRRLSRAGARQALLQALAIVLALALAGGLTHALSDRLQADAMREHVLGEVRSVDDEYAHHGGPQKLPHTLAKRTRLWRGFSYRLVGPDGRLMAGDLPDTGVAEGWSRIPGEANAASPSRRPFLVFAKRLPDGSHVWVGQDISAQVLQSSALLHAHLFSGLVGVMFGVSVSYLVSRRAWRRVAAIAEVARRVKGGGSDPRAPTPRTPPQDDLDDLALNFNAMLDRISDLVGQVRQVSRDIAHDMRTPLNRVRHRLERLRMDVEDQPALAARIESIEEDIGETLRTFDAMLQLAEIEAGSLEAQRPFDLGELASRIGEAFRPDVEEGGRVLDISSAPVMAVGHERLVSQALANLIENAARHTPAGARIRVRVEAAPPRVVVEDDGPGIAPEHRETVLRPLVRLEASRHLPGSGLGLSIVAAVAGRHGAALELADAGPGLRASLVFRAPEEAHAADGRPAVLHKEARSAPRPIGPPGWLAPGGARA
jgi:signal transduction histidine kinase